MKDEIKEILDNPKILMLSYGNYVSLDDYFKLKDCITNLQEENKEWSMIFDTFSKRPYAHKYLEQKKKELGNDKIIGLDSEMIYKDYYDYKSRNEKASKIVKDIFKDENWYNNYDYNDLENALKEVDEALTGGDE